MTTSSPPQHRRPRPEESWRMVEGENDSFDTTILPSLGDSPPPSSGSFSMPTQPFSQDGLSFESQDSIRDFNTHQDDEQVILREPFRPSMSGLNISNTGNNSYRTPDPEFRMPRVDVDSEGTASGRTIRGYGANFAADRGGIRRRTTDPTGSPLKHRSDRRRYDDRDHNDYYHRDLRYERRRMQEGGFDGSISGALYHGFGWILGVVALAFRYAQRPLAILLAIYLSFGGIIIAQNMATRSITASLSPLCRIPGASFFNIPFCPSPDTIITDPNGPSPAPVEFDDLMSVQAQFEQVLEKSADGVSLPFEIKRSETAIRDLRSLVRHSDLQARDELLLEFDGYVDTARRTSSDLQKFNTHVGSAVDAVISINRWTSRYIDTLAPDSDDDASSGALIGWTSWLFHPFQPTLDPMFNERILLNKYVEHTALVSERIATLILEAQAVLRLLTKAEDHLALIYDISSRSSADTKERRESALWNVWSMVGGNSAQIKSLSQQLALLRQVDIQRSSAVAQVNALILELESIEAGLGDLRDRVAEPALLQGTNRQAVPLSVHIETIDRGVERLEDARRRIRAAENDRVRDALLKGGLRDDDRMLD